MHPTRGGEVLPAQGILTLSPYSVLGRNGDADSYVPRGYARMYADVVGTGNSGGCYDYGGIREKETAYDLVEWIVAQPWSRGRIGMATDRTWATLAPAVVDVDPAGSFPSVPVTRGWLDTRYAAGLAAPKPGDGTGLRTAMPAHPTDWTFRKGHRIALVLQTASLEWVLPKAYDGVPTRTYDLELGAATSLTLPLVAPGDLRTLFAG